MVHNIHNWHCGWRGYTSSRLIAVLLLVLLSAACGKDEKNSGPPAPRNWDQYFAQQDHYQIWREIIALDSASLPPFRPDWLVLAPPDSLMLQRQQDLGIEDWSQWPAQMGAALFSPWLASHFLSASPGSYRPSAGRNIQDFALQRHWREGTEGPWADGQVLRAQGGAPALYALSEIASLPTLHSALLVGPQPPSLFAQALARCSSSLRARLNQPSPYTLLVASDSAIAQYWQAEGLRNWDHFIERHGAPALNALVAQHIVPGYQYFPKLQSWQGPSLAPGQNLQLVSDSAGLWMEKPGQNRLQIKPEAVHCFNGCFYPLLGLLNFP